MAQLHYCLAASIFALVSLGILHQGYSIQCYECNTNDTPSCANLNPDDPFQYLVNCTGRHPSNGGSPDVCFVASVKGALELEGKNHISRGCTKEPSDRTFCSRMIPYTVCRFCNENGCNSMDNRFL